MDEIAAFRRMKAGDFGGLEGLMERYQVKVARAAFLITHDKARAEDVVQEVFVRLFQHTNRFDETHPFEPDLMRSAVNSALNACRDKNVPSRSMAISRPSNGWSRRQFQSNRKRNTFNSKARF